MGNATKGIEVQIEIQVQNDNNNSKKHGGGVYKGKNKLSPKDLEQYLKDHKCFKHGEKGQTYYKCPTKKQHKKDKPKGFTGFCKR